PALHTLPLHDALPIFATQTAPVEIGGQAGIAAQERGGDYQSSTCEAPRQNRATRSGHAAKQHSTPLSALAGDQILVRRGFRTHRLVNTAPGAAFADLPVRLLPAGRELPGRRIRAETGT